MMPIGEVAQIGRQVAGTDEHPVDAVDAGNGFNVVERRARLYLDEDTDLFVSSAMIVGHSAKSVGAVCDRDATNTERWISRRCDRPPGFVSRLNERHENRTRTDVE